MNKNVEPGWLLHTYPLRDHLYLVYVLTPTQILKAFYRRSKRKQLDILPQSFVPYWWTWTGQQQNFSIQGLEFQGPALDLHGLKLYVALYMNELIFHLGRQGQILPQFYALYEELLYAPLPLNQVLLRRFEWQLLADCGYALDFTMTADLEPIQADQYYQFCPEQGFLVQAEGISGLDLLLINQNQFERPQTLGIYKIILGRLIDYLLAGKTLHSRQLLKHWMQTNAK